MRTVLTASYREEMNELLTTPTYPSFSSQKGSNSSPRSSRKPRKPRQPRQPRQRVPIERETELPEDPAHIQSVSQQPYPLPADIILPPGSRPGDYNQSYSMSAMQGATYGFAHQPHHQLPHQQPPQQPQPQPQPQTTFQGGYPHQPNVNAQPTPINRPYLCDVPSCPRFVPGEGFTTLNDLERHSRSVHGGSGQYIECREPGCPEAGKYFPRRDNFVDHWKRLHGGEMDSEEAKAKATKCAQDWMFDKSADQR